MLQREVGCDCDGVGPSPRGGANLTRALSEGKQRASRLARKLNLSEQGFAREPSSKESKGIDYEDKRSASNMIDQIDNFLDGAISYSFLPQGRGTTYIIWESSQKSSASAFRHHGSWLAWLERNDHHLLRGMGGVSRSLRGPWAQGSWKQCDRGRGKAGQLLMNGTITTLVHRKGPGSG